MKKCLMTIITTLTIALMIVLGGCAGNTSDNGSESENREPIVG